MSENQISVLQTPNESQPVRLTTSGSGETEEKMPAIPSVLSILPVRSFVIFPGTVLPLTIGRTASIKLLDETLPQSKIIGLLTQRDENKEEPEPKDLYSVGTAAIVLKLLRQADNQSVAVVQGLRRFSLRKIVSTHPYLRAEVDLLETIRPAPSKEWEATFRNLRDTAAKLFELSPDIPEQARAAVLSIDDPEQLVDFLAPNLQVDAAQKQAILEELDLEKRLRAVQTNIFLATGDRADPAAIAERCAVAIFRCTASRVFARAIKGDSARARRRRGRGARSGSATAHAARGSETAGRCARASRSRIKAPRFYSAGEPGVFRHCQLHRDDRGVAVVEIQRGQHRSRSSAADSRSRPLRSRKSEAAADSNIWLCAN